EPGTRASPSSARRPAMSCRADSLAILSLVLAWVTAGTTSAQEPWTSVILGAKTGGSRNIKVLGHLAMDSIEKTSDITVVQELSRPYAYTAHRLGPAGIDLISSQDPAKPRVIYSWQIEHGELHK